MSLSPLVLVVDDDASVRRALARLLRSEGLEVETFPSAEALLEWTPPARPVCVVCDLRLPGPSGLDLQARLVEAHPAVAIVFITGHGNVPASVQAMKRGAVDFLEKPVDADQLLACVRHALGRSQQARADRAARLAIEQRIETLTPREREVLGLVVKGLLNKQIAERLGAAEKTVKIHRGRMMEKMQARSLADLVRMSEHAALRQARP